MSKTVHQEIEVAASPERIYDSYMDSKRHAAFTANGDADISRDAGGAFSCHGGAIVGRNLELVPNRRIVQAWRVADWDEGVYSVVRLELKPEGDGTRIVLDHWGLPEGSEEHIDSGWHTRYWDPLKKYLA
jgi:activator of HSP90 ATPase